jgi:ATP-dependent Clp protease ATP-binding subunit ClpA
LREQLLLAVQPHPGPAAGDAGLTPPARQALRFAVHEAQGLNHAYVGQEHLLLALTRPVDQQGENAREFTSVTLLRTVGVDVEALRQAVMEAMTRGIRSARDNVIACRVDDRVLDSIDALIEAGIHATRSEAAARLILDGLEANRPLLERVQAAVADIRRLREQTQRLAQQWRAERTASPSTPDSPSGSSSGEAKGTADRAASATRKRSRRQSG